jgi:hypothetical protein
MLYGRDAGLVVAASLNTVPHGNAAENFSEFLCLDEGPNQSFAIWADAARLGRRMHDGTRSAVRC